METVEEVDEQFAEYDTTGDWKSCSFMIELKPRSDQASLFIDLPPSAEDSEGNKRRVNYLKVGKNRITYGGPHENDILVDGDSVNPLPHADIRYSRSLTGMSFVLSPMNSTTWAEGSARVFSCKLKVSVGEKSLPFKPLHKLAKEMSSRWSTEQFVRQTNGKQANLACSQCCKGMLKSSEVEFGYLPSDDWMNICPSVDYYCRDSCGPSCDPNRHGDHRKGVESEGLHDQWNATAEKLMISPSTVVVHTDSLADGAISDIEEVENGIACGNCKADLGWHVKGKPDLLMLHHGSAWVSYFDDEESSNEERRNDALFIDRYPDIDMFFTHLLLNISEEQSSVKILIRDLRKRAHILIWLMDSYAGIATGELLKEDAAIREDSEPHPVEVRPVVKVLYKNLNEETAANDPRANGEDASVGIIQLPYPAIEASQLALRKSTRAMPVACRTVGLFFVGFLPLDTHI